MFCSAPTDDAVWYLLYTKPQAESWAEANLRNQGYIVLLPRVAGARGFAPLFPRYLFAGVRPDLPFKPLRSTFGVHSVVHFGEHPVRVPPDVIDDVRGRMDVRGVVHLDVDAQAKPLFSMRERERVRALIKLAEAGFRVKSA